MEDNKNIEELKQEGWEDMSALLDTHMPHKDHRRMVWWYWLAGAAAVLLAVSIPLAILMNSDAAEESIHSIQDEALFRKETNVNNAEDKMESDISSLQPQDSRVTDKENGHDYLADEGNLFSSANAKMQRKNGEQRKFLRNIRSENEVKTTTGGQRPKEIFTEGYNLPDVKVLHMPVQGIGHLEQPSYLVQQPEISLRPFFLKDTKKIEVEESSGKLAVSIFSEMMWSLSDQFGFVNIGPGIKYSFRKWALGLSGGLSIPLPKQKAFYSSNLPFSNLYNFGSSLDSKFEMSSPGVSGAQSIYYEKYSMKPGYVLNLSLQRQLTGRLGIGVDVGHIGFRYDFTQKAKPNPNFAASTELTGIRNSLWYGGLSVNYQLGHHWMVHGGIKMVNVWNPGDVGLLPGVRLEYGF